MTATIPAESTVTVKADDAPTWAVVELMGHVKHAGRLSEEERFGSKIGRLDIPNGPTPGCACCKGLGVIPEMCPRPNQEAGTTPCPLCGGYRTMLFGGASVYRVQVVSEAVARHVARQTAAYLPVASWDFPKALPPAEPVSGHPGGDDGDDDDADFDDDETDDIEF